MSDYYACVIDWYDITELLASGSYMRVADFRDGELIWTER